MLANGRWDLIRYLKGSIGGGGVDLNIFFFINPYPANVGKIVNF
jgi:hypothetical protein